MCPDASMTSTHQGNMSSPQYSEADVATLPVVICIYVNRCALAFEIFLFYYVAWGLRQEEHPEQKSVPNQTCKSIHCGNLSGNEGI